VDAPELLGVSCIVVFAILVNGIIIMFEDDF
jgi:hypothetical protein